MSNVRLTHVLTLLRLLNPANFVYSFAYLRKYGVRLCVSRIAFLLCLAVGYTGSAKQSPTSQPPVHKVTHKREPLRSTVPDAPVLTDGCRDALRLELAAIKDDLTDTLLSRSRRRHG